MSHSSLAVAYMGKKSKKMKVGKKKRERKDADRHSFLESSKDKNDSLPWNLS